MQRGPRSRDSRLRKATFASLASPVPGDVLACMDELGMQNTRQVEDEITAACPMHEVRTGKPDRHPSFSVNSESGVFNCFSCGYKGPFVVLVRDLLKMDHSDAVLWVRARGSIERVRASLRSTVENLPRGPVDTSKQYNEASLALFTYPPVSALQKRFISLAAASHYGIRWWPEKEAWITPIRDIDGEMLGWQEKNERYFCNRPRDVKKSEHLFGLDVFPGGWIRVVESPLDTARIFTAGLEGTVSSYGAAVSQRQIDLIIENADGVIFALDADRAGDKQSEYLRQYFLRRGFPCRFWDYTGTSASDPGEMTNEQIHTAESGAYSGVVARFADY